MKRRWLIFLPLLILTSLFLVGPLFSARATTIPVGFSETTVVSGLSNPTAFAMTPDGRIFVTQQGGAVRVIKNGALLGTPFLTRTVNSSGERGMLGIAFDPDFTNNHYVYLYYTTNTPAAHNKVVRVTANGDVETVGSEITILDLNNLSSATNHNGGALHFGLDGDLYVAVGENANGSNSQTLNNLLGKILRLDVRDGADPDTLPDALIPTDNPFYGTASGNNRLIWARGLRNPFTFSVQPDTGRIFINDVGQSTWEEINDGVAGANYGWPTTEGDFNQSTYPNFKRPFHFYNHSGACAITGGAFYNPSDPGPALFPADYAGDYFFADYCGSFIKRIDTTTKTVTNFAMSTQTFPVDLMVGPDGSLYYLSRGAGRVMRIFYTGNQPPTIVQPPQDLTVTEGRPATFTCQASSTETPTYQWQRDGVDIPGATSSSYVLPTTTIAADNGAAFNCVATNSFGSTPSDVATLTVVPNQPPQVQITAPLDQSFYRGGQKIIFAGTATDPEDGVLPASRFQWSVVFHHADHDHGIFYSKTGVKSGYFITANTGHTETDVFYRITLTVTDSDGMQSTTFVDILPTVVTLTVQANIPGPVVMVDGQPDPTPLDPLVFDSVVGVKRVPAAPSPQMFDGGFWVFKAWSDSGARQHTIITPTVNKTYTASFAVVSLQNRSFEIDADLNIVPDKWAFAYRGLQDQLDCGTAFDAVCSMKLVGDRTTTTMAQGLALKGPAGDSYTLNFATRGDNLSANGFKVIVKYIYADGTAGAQVFILPAGTYDWTPQSIVFSPAKKYAAIKIYVRSMGRSTGTAWFDDFDLVLN